MTLESLDIKWATSNAEKQELLRVCLMSILGHIDYLKDQAQKDRLWLYQAISNNQFGKLSGIINWCKDAIRLNGVENQTLKRTAAKVEARLRTLIRITEGKKPYGKRRYYDEERLEVDAIKRARTHLLHRPIHFGQIPASLLNDSKVGLDEKGLYAYLHSRSYKKKLAKYPRIEIARATIAKSLGISTSTVARTLKRLVDAGWISSFQQGKTRGNLYILWPEKRSTFEARLIMARIFLKLSRDHELVKMLRDSLDIPPRILSKREYSRSQVENVETLPLNYDLLRFFPKKQEVVYQI
jgi:DNA-binding MarR family transcriptional regulator